MLKVHTDECETDSTLASDQESIWQASSTQTQQSDHRHEQWNVFIYPCTFLRVFPISWLYGACWWWQVHLTLAEEFKPHPTAHIQSFLHSPGGRLHVWLLYIQLSVRLVYSGTQAHCTPLTIKPTLKKSHWEFGGKSAAWILSFSVCFLFAFIVPLLFLFFPFLFPEGTELHFETELSGLKYKRHILKTIRFISHFSTWLTVPTEMFLASSFVKGEDMD